MEKRSFRALVAAFFAASIVGCGLDTGPDDERVAGDGVLPSNAPPSESPNTPSTPPGGAQNPDTPAPGQPTGPAPTTPPTPGTKFIFLTSTRVRGDLKVGGYGTSANAGGIGINIGGGEDEDSKKGRDAADLICQTEAKKANLPGTYLAWLSKSDEDAIKRMPENAGGWSLPTGQLVFPNRAHIAEGKGPLRQIIVYASGWYLTGSGDVWTATSEKGIATGSTCNNWESSNGSSVSGAAYYTDKKWTNNSSDWCSNERRLICFQTN